LPRRPERTWTGTPPGRVEVKSRFAAALAGLSVSQLSFMEIRRTESSWIKSRGVSAEKSLGIHTKTIPRKKYFIVYSIV
jgi:hypothetical protein